MGIREGNSLAAWGTLSSPIYLIWVISGVLGGFAAGVPGIHLSSVRMRSEVSLGFGWGTAPTRNRDGPHMTVRYL